MVIDIHTHTFPDKIAKNAVHTLQDSSHTASYSDGTEAELVQTERKAGVSLAVVQPVATYPKQVISINRHVIERFGENPPPGLLSFAAMHPACPVWEEELERAAAAGLPGVKLHPPYAQVDIDDPRTIRILKKCAALDLAVLIHAGWDVGLPGHEEALPQKIRRALDAVGPIRLIAGHMGGWKCWEEAAGLLADTGVCVDTAFSLGQMEPAPDSHPWRKEDLQMLTKAEFCDLVHAYGADRVLFGTDSPWADPSAELEKLRSLPLAKEEISAICSGNALRFLSLNG